MVYSEFSEDRKISVLDNFSKNKSYICKKLGVICDADVNRVATRLKNLRKLNNKETTV